MLPTLFCIIHTDLSATHVHSDSTHRKTDVIHIIYIYSSIKHTHFHFIIIHTQSDITHAHLSNPSPDITLTHSDTTPKDSNIHSGAQLLHSD